MGGRKRKGKAIEIMYRKGSKCKGKKLCWNFEYTDNGKLQRIGNPEKIASVKKVD